MQLDSKGWLFIVAVLITMVGGAYSLGLSHGRLELQSQAHNIAAPPLALPTLSTEPDLNVPATAPVKISSQLVPAKPETPKPNSTIQTLATPSHQPPMATNNNTPLSAPPKFAHFRVGNRNVKGMHAVGNLVWVGTSGGVLRYDLTTDNYDLFDVANGSLLSNGVFHVSSLEGNIVVGTYGGGLSMYNPDTAQWRNYNIPDGLADQFVYDVQKVSTGDVWIATWSGVNQVLDGDLDDPSKWRTFDVENTQGGLPNEWVYGLEEGKQGSMWFATEKGLARYQNGQWTNWQHEHGLGAAYELVENDITFKNDPSKASEHHAQQKLEHGLTRVNVAYNPNYIVSLQVDQQGIVWCGTWGGGLARFDGHTWRNFTVQDGLPANHIFMLNLDDKGRLWAGTSHGLALLNEDGETFTVMRRDDGLYADNVFSMANASDGSMWVGSFGGVARLYSPL